MVTPGELTWGEDLSAEPRRRLRQALLVSALAHLFLVSWLFVLPEPVAFILPPAIDIELLAALPAAPEASTPVPVRKPKLKILPKHAPSATAKPRVKPAPEVVRRRPKPKELALDDALAKLRGDLGEKPAVVPKPATSARAATAALSAKGTRPATERDAWALSVMRHIRSGWVMLPEFRDLQIATRLEVMVAADGGVVGVPKVTRSSGNPYYDDNAIRTIQKSSPLPAPPKAGRYSIIFAPEEPR